MVVRSEECLMSDVEGLKDMSARREDGQYRDEERKREQKEDQ